MEWSDMADLKIIRKSDQKQSEWSGGTTTELAIFPEGSLYADRNFLWRLSSAKVLVPVSVFTSLPGVSRVLMVLDGNMELSHRDHYSIELKPFEQDSFSGDWHSESRGCVTDFNLMTSGDCRGEVKYISLGAGEITGPDYTGFGQIQTGMTEALYLVRGRVRISFQGDSHVLGEGDVALLNRTRQGNIVPIMLENGTEGTCGIVYTAITY